VQFLFAVPETWKGGNGSVLSLEDMRQCNLMSKHGARFVLFFWWQRGTA
jgi:hypothetical protein